MLRLKEQPAEWIKFTAVIGLAVNIVIFLISRGLQMPAFLSLGGIALAILAIIVAVIRPHWFRGFYRGGMTASFHFGQVVGKVLLTLFFFLLVTPMGLFLRLLGKDLLRIKNPPEATTHWHTAKSTREFDRMF